MKPAMPGDEIMPETQELPDDVVEVWNHADGPTVFTDKASDTEIVWQGKGDPGGEDCQAVAVKITKLPPFRNAINNGVLSRSRDAVAPRKSRSPIKTSANNRNLDLAVVPNNDYSTVQCMGPGQRGDHRCGVDLTIPTLQLKTIPPLCERHKMRYAQMAKYNEVTQSWNVTIS